MLFIQGVFRNWLNLQLISHRRLFGPAVPISLVFMRHISVHTQAMRLDPYNMKYSTPLSILTPAYT